MPFEIFLIPGLMFFVLGIFKGLNYYNKEYSRNEESK